MDDDDGDGLTAGMAAAWGARAPATKGPKPGLSLNRIHPWMSPRSVPSRQNWTPPSA